MTMQETSAARVGQPYLIYYPTQITEQSRRVANPLYTEAMRTKKIGDTVCMHYGAPYTGRLVVRITRMDATGVHGTIVEDTGRELTVADVE